MARIKIDLPVNLPFSAIIPVRITDLNYAGHVGNDSILSIIHEARVLFFVHHGYTELNLAGVGTIMSDVGIEFKRELFYGDVLRASVTAGGFSRVSFELFYKLEKITSDGREIPVAFAKTEVVTYDYAKKKIVPVPEEVWLKFTSQ